MVENKDKTKEDLIFKDKKEIIQKLVPPVKLTFGIVILKENPVCNEAKVFNNNDELATPTNNKSLHIPKDAINDKTIPVGKKNKIKKNRILKSFSKD